MASYQPQPGDKFTFGLWTLGNPGRDPFGDVVRQGFTPIEMCEALGKMGVYGLNFHDNDLLPLARPRPSTTRSWPSSSALWTTTA
jgi:xylose isomerase